MDILYIVGKDSKCDNMELRWGLRSIDKYGIGVDRVYVCGECPQWLSDEVIKIPCDDINKDTIHPTQKAQNIANKLLYAVDNSDIGSEFLVSMDDHFYTKDVDFNEYPYYVKYTNSPFLPEVKTPKMNEYTKWLVDCKNRLDELGLPTFHFTLHRNMRISRDAIDGCRQIIDENMKNFYPFEAFVLINNYAFLNGLCSPEFVEDVRINKASEWWKSNPKYSNVFSTASFDLKSGLYTLMDGLYTKKSKYEI